MILLGEALLLVAVLAVFYVIRNLDRIQRPVHEDAEVKVNENLPEETKQTLSGFTTVALFGLDTRDSGQLGRGTNSDTIIIAAINNDTKEVKLASVYRDTYLDLTNGRYNKCNGAYTAGGPDQAMSMLNTNLDLNIDEYVSVDWSALIKTVDLLGGVMIDVDEAEIKHLNNYQNETSESTNVAKKPVTETGLQLLNGIQATSYCRIRFTAGDDFKRTERQREVILEMVNRAKKEDIGKLNDIIDEVFPMIATSYTNKELVSLAPDMLSYNIVDTTGFPFDKTTGTIKGKGDCVIPIDLEANVKQLHEFLYGNYSYTPSSEVRAISDQIVLDTGIGGEDEE